MKARNLMKTPAVTVLDDASLLDAARLMIEKSVGALPVVNASGKLVGIITESDYYTLKEQGVPFSLFRAPQLFGRWLDSGGVEKAYQAAAKTPVRDVMVTSVITIDAEASIEDILRAMLNRDLHRIPVVSGGKVVGMITRRDLLRGMASEWPATGTAA